MRCVPKPFSTKPTMPLFPIPPELRERVFLNTPLGYPHRAYRLGYIGASCCLGNPSCHFVA